MSKGVMQDAEQAVGIAESAVRRAEFFFDWEGNGPRHTGLKKLREQLGEIQGELARLSNLLPEALSEDHRLQ